MTPVHLLSDVDVVAISIVDKGANGRRFYLRKQEDETEALITLPAEHKLIKAGPDWSTAYCVVAEPGFQEAAGAGSPGVTIKDEWASADEIRLAAHKFMKNGPLVNKMHESLLPYGTLVENFVAQSDHKVGSEVIKEGAWVVGISPSDEGKQKIEAGEFTGVSIQGTGLRKLIEKNQGEGAVEGTLELKVDHEDKNWLRAIGNKLGISKEDISKEDEPVVSTTKEEDVADATTNERLEKIEGVVEKSSAAVEALAGRIADIAQSLADSKKKDEEGDDPAQEVYHRLDEVAKSLDTIREDVGKLATGESRQTEERQTVKKTEGHALAGLLFDD